MHIVQNACSEEAQSWEAMLYTDLKETEVAQRSKRVLPVWYYHLPRQVTKKLQEMAGSFLVLVMKDLERTMISARQW